MRLARTARMLRGELMLVVVLAVVAVGFVILLVEGSHWLRGVVVMGSAFVLAGVLRLVLSERRAGSLAVRGRLFDVICYFVLGVLIITFAVLAPAHYSARV
ncbi:MAG: DUF3017 domain-containing protein [Actinobacteria bacterium]|nr:DUF3017 domain-containing protein [Actinomycetota bacterium]